MPGKVNPVIPEVMSQICYKVMGNELCVTMAGEAAQMELNAMEPVMAQCDFESVDLMINGFRDSPHPLVWRESQPTPTVALPTCKQQHRHRHGPQSRDRLQELHQDRQGSSGDRQERVRPLCSSMTSSPKRTSTPSSAREHDQGR